MNVYRYPCRCSFLLHPTAFAWRAAVSLSRRSRPTSLFSVGLMRSTAKCKTVMACLLSMSDDQCCVLHSPQTVVLCIRARNAILHDGLPFQRQSELLKAENLGLTTSAKLVICSLAAEKSMTASTQSSQDRLIQLMRAVKTCLHPLGTVAMLVPHPWYDHSKRLAGKCIF